ncbi:carbohydrate kinase family protein [Patescibacteria group bacterium]|nr:MAG: carbohydrate kinase family protein [Patescibacteria group bacterium]
MNLLIHTISLNHMHTYVSGSLAYDRISKFEGKFSNEILPEKIHDLNVSFYVESLNESFGGTAGNIAYTLGLLGENVSIFATAGNDFLNYQKWLSEHGVGTDLIVIDDSRRTAFASIVTDQKENQITTFYAGAMLSPYPLATLKIEPETSFVIIAPGNPTDMATLPKYCKELNVPYMFDPGQQLAHLSGDVIAEGIEGSEVCISNEYERELILKKTGWDLKTLVTKTKMLVTTLGENGSEIHTQTGVITAPGIKVTIKDPTGAGDAYRAGFVYALNKGWGHEIIAKFANLVACYTIEQSGTQTHSFTLEALRERFLTTFNQALPA